MIGGGNLRRYVSLVLVALLILGPFVQGWDGDPGSNQFLPAPSKAAIGSANNRTDEKYDLSMFYGHVTENLGQLEDHSVRYYCIGSPLSVAFGRSTIFYKLSPTGSDKGAMFQVNFEGANAVEPIGVDPMDHKSNFFIGNDPEGWVTGANNYREVWYHDLYDGIDLRFRFTEGWLKYDYIVVPGADPSTIQMDYEGIDDLSIDKASGDLLIRTAAGDLIDLAPISSQPSLDPDIDVGSWYVLVDGKSISFEISDYDECHDLIIDPGLEFMTYIGGTDTERFDDKWCSNSDVDAEGNVFITARTYSTDFPTTNGAYDTELNSTNDAIVVKLSKDGTKLEYSTYIGGTENNERPCCVKVGPDGAAYLAIKTGSSDYPTTPGAYKNSSTGSPGSAITKLDKDGSSLVYSTFITVNYILALHLNADGSLYASGYTSINGFPIVAGCYQTNLSNGPQDAFIIWLSDDGSSVIKATLFGGSAVEAGLNIVVRSDRTVFISGRAISDDMPITANAFQSDYQGREDGFIARFDENLTTLLASTFLGGSDLEWGPTSMVLDPDENVVVAGRTESTDFPTTSDGFRRTMKGYEDVYIVKMDPGLEKLLYGTYFGGSGSEGDLTGLCYTEHGELIFSSHTTSSDLPVTDNSFDSSLTGTGDLFIARFNLSNKVKYLSYIGGSAHDGFACNVHHGINTTLVGSTGSTDLPTTVNAYQRIHSGEDDLFVARLWTGHPPDAEPPSAPLNLSMSVDGKTVTLTWEPPEDQGGAPVYGYRVYRGTLETSLKPIRSIVGQLTFYDSPPLIGTTYYYAVSAYHENEGNLSNIVNLTIYESPLIPTGFSASAVCGTVHLNWTPPVDTGGQTLLGYRLYRGTSTASITLLEELGQVTNYIDSNVTHGTTYLYQVSAFTGFGESGRSRILTIQSVGPPVAPVEIVAKGLNGKVLITWRPPLRDGGREIIGYQVARGYSNETLTPLSRLDWQTDSFIDDDVINGRIYYYAVRAYNEIGDGPWSITTSALPIGPPGAVVDPVALIGDGNVTLSWTVPGVDGGDPEIGYLIFRDPTDDELLPYVVLNGTKFVDTNVTNGVSYQYIIVAFNMGGRGPDSEIVNAVPMGLSDPPENFSYSPGSRFIGLSWEPPMDSGGTPVTRYIIYRGTTPVSLAYHDEVSSPLTTFVDIDVDDGQTYFYMVTAVTRAGEGFATEIISATSFGAPGSPLDLKVSSGDGFATLSWEAPLSDGGREIWGYVVFKGDREDGLEEIARLANVLTYTEDHLVNGRTYYFAVAAFNSIDDGPISEIIPALPVGRPGIPRSFQASEADGTILLTWLTPLEDGGSALVGFTLLRGTSPSEMEVIANLGVVGSYTDRDVVKGIPYHYRIMAVNGLGEGDPSPVANIELERETEAVTGMNPWMLLAALMGVVLMTVGAISSTEPSKYWWGLLFSPLATRLAKDEVLDNKTRYALHGIVSENPGIHYNAILKEFKLSNGVAAYHLDVLAREGFIRSVRDGRLKRFYSTDTKVPWERRETPEEMRESIIELVSSRPGISQKEIVNELGINRDTVGYHLRCLVDDGSLDDDHKGNFTIYYLGGKH
jgi:predicted transcriptional regulator/fibronectin type 3 domain-containing protein